MFVLASGRIRLLGDCFGAKTAKNTKRKSELQRLIGWQQISAFLGQPISLVRRWARQGMPIKKRGRFVTATVAELDRWLGE